MTEPYACVDCRALFCERCSERGCTCDHGLTPEAAVMLAEGLMGQ